MREATGALSGQAQPATDRLLRQGEVCRMTALSGATIKKYMREPGPGGRPLFPAPVQTSADSKTGYRWFESEILDWISKLPRERFAARSEAE